MSAMATEHIINLIPDDDSRQKKKKLREAVLEQPAVPTPPMTLS